MNELKSHILKHVFFSEHDHVVKICQPLKNIGIEGFIFMRHYPDGSFLDLGSHLKWGDYFFNRYFEGKYTGKDLQNSMFIPESSCLSILNKNNLIWEDAARNFGLGNGITMHKSFDDYYELYCFYSTYQNHAINEFYINNIDYLKKFILYFKDKSSEIIKKGDKNRLMSLDIYTNNVNAPISPPNKKMSQFLQEIHCSSMPIDDTSAKKSLSHRELACVKLCSRGMTSIETGQKLFVSPRTVEKHLDNAKKKLSCRNLCELVLMTSHIYGL